MGSDFKSAFVRIFQTDTTYPVGAGFLVDQQHLITCAHVVADALGIDRRTTTSPQHKVRLDFALATPGQILTAKVVAWQPVLPELPLIPPEQGEDIAVLELEHALPDGVFPLLPLVLNEGDFWKKKARVYGFPRGQDQGVYAEGELKGSQSNDWVQLDEVTGLNYFIEPGFSGGPVWDENAGGIVGIVVAADLRANIRNGRMIPTSVLVRAWPPLKDLLYRPAATSVSSSQSPVPIYISYAPADKPYLDELEEHFSLTRRQKLVAIHHSGDNLPGDTTHPVVLDEAKLVMLMLSSAYFSNDNCWDVELARSLQRREQKQTVIVPVIVRPCNWYDFEIFTRLKPLLPEDGKPVILYEQRDVAYKNIISSVRALLVNEVSQLRSSQDVFIAPIDITPSPISGQAAAIPTGLVIPSLPDNYLRRNEALGDIRAKLLSERTAVGITGRMLGLQGMGGIGKTMLAAMIAVDEDVKKHFSGGVFWLAVGQNPDLVSLQNRLGAALGDTRPITDFNKGREQLAETLKDRECLLVLDDLWEAGPVNYLAPLGEKGRLLFTTRKKQVVNDLTAGEHELGLLNPAEALKFLAGVVDPELQNLPSEAKKVARECGYLPLALSMAGALVRKNGWSGTLQKLRQAGIIGAGMELPEYAQLYRTMEASLAELNHRDQERYLQLAVFKEEAAIPLEALAVLWGLERFATDELAARLGNSALVFWTANYTALTLHDLQRDYLYYRIKKRLPQLHQGFAKTYRLRGKGEYWEVPDDGYYYQNLVYHLAQAGEKVELKNLLLNYHWSETRLKNGRMAELLTDYDFLPGDEEVELVKEALDLTAHIVADKPEQLAMQLYGRLLSYRDLPGIQRLLEQMEQEGSKPRLRPLQPTLVQAGGPLKRTLTGHRDRVNAVAISPDGQFVISASNDKSLIVWDRLKGEPVHSLKGHNTVVNAVAFSPDGQFAISASGDKTLIVWDWQKGEQICSLTGHRDRVNALAFSPDGQFVISASNDKSLIVWDWQKGNQIQSLKGHSDGVTTVAFSPDGQFAVSASGDKTLIVWDWQKGDPIHSLKGHGYFVNAVAFSPDGQFVISASNDKTLIVWDWKKGDQIRPLKGHSSGVNAVAFSPDGQFVISASNDKTLIVWDWKKGDQIRPLEGHSSAINAVAFSPDGQFVISASNDKTLIVWDWKKGDQIRPLEGHSSAVNAVAFSPDGQFVISASNDKSLIVWDRLKCEPVHPLKGHSSAVNAVAFSPNGQFVISASNDRSLIVWDWKNHVHTHSLTGYGSFINAVAISPNGQYTIFVSSDTSLIVWDWQKNQQIHTLKGHSSAITAVAFSPDGQFAISASYDKSLIVWDWKKGELIRSLIGHRNSATAVAFSPDGQFVISASWDNTLIVWDWKKGELIRSLIGHRSEVKSLVFSPDGHFVISASEDKSLIVWNWQIGEIVHTTNLESSALCCALSPDSYMVVAGDAGGRVYFFGFETD